VSAYDFFRIHSAYLVNLEHIERMLDKGCVLVKNASLPIAQRRMQEFKKEYMEYIRRHFGA
jgi:DNA-binding LytR/AlgR family response regulator